MTRDEAVGILERWSAEPMIRRLMPLIVTAVRLVIGAPKVTVGESKTTMRGWRDPD